MIHNSTKRVKGYQTKASKKRRAEAEATDDDKRITGVTAASRTGKFRVTAVYCIGKNGGNVKFIIATRKGIKTESIIYL